MSKREDFGNFLLPFFLPFFSLITMETFDQKQIKIKKLMAFLCHGPLTIAKREYILPLPLQNHLEHDMVTLTFFS
jgi:hypothetical protein